MAFKLPEIPQTWEDDSDEEIPVAPRKIFLSGTIIETFSVNNDDAATETSVQFISETRRFQKEEDITILEFVKKNNYYERVKGIEIWRQLAREMDNTRSYESLKGRFRTTILANIEDLCEELEYSQDVLDKFLKVKEDIYPKHLICVRKKKREAYTSNEDGSKNHFFHLFFTNF